MANFGKTAEIIVMGVMGVVGTYAVGTSRVGVAPDPAGSVVDTAVDEQPTEVDAASADEPITLDDQVVPEVEAIADSDDVMVDDAPVEEDANAADTEALDVAAIDAEPEIVPEPETEFAAFAKPEVDLSRFDGATAIISGTAQPNGTIAAIDQNGEVARGTADGAGNFALSFDYEPPQEGSVIEIIALNAAGVASDAAVVTVLPSAEADAAPVVVELTEDDAVIGDNPAPTTDSIALGEVAYGGNGATSFKGSAAAGRVFDLMIDGNKIGRVEADENGVWAFDLDQKLAAGTHRLALVDEAGQVFEQGFDIAEAAVAEAPVDDEAPTPTEVATNDELETNTDLGTDIVEDASSPAVVEDVIEETGEVADAETVEEPESTEASPAPIDASDGATPDAEVANADQPDTTLETQVGATTYTVKRGDSLWRIARERFGEGIRYVDIYDANSGKIKNPDLIFPGQVFEIDQ